MAITDFISANSEILKTIQRTHPHIYDELSKDELTTFSLLLHIESFLQENTMQYMSNYLAETAPLTAETYESLINHAITRGYTPRFCKPAEGKLRLMLPVYNNSKNYYMNSSTNIYFDKNIITLKGTSSVTNNDVNYQLKYNYKLVTNGFNAVLYVIMDNGQTMLSETNRSTTTIDGDSVDCISFDVDIIQIDSIVNSTSYVENYSSLDFPTISLPILPDEIYNLYKVEIVIDNIEAIYIPVLTVADLDNYYYTIRLNENSIVAILSNGIYGKKTLPSSIVSSRVYLTSGKSGNVYEDSIQLTTQIINQVNGQNINFVTKNYRISNGEDIEDYRSIKMNILSSLLSNDRLVTVDDYVTTLESTYYGEVKVLPTSRLYSYGSNDVAVYLAIKKDEDPLYGTPVYFKTDTKSLVIRYDDLSNKRVFMKGDYLIVPSNIVLKESSNLTNDLIINKSGSLTLIDGIYGNINDLVNMQNANDIDKKWLPILSYVINTKYPIDNKAYITSGYKNIVPLTAMMDSTIYSVNVAVAFGTMKSVINPSTMKSELYFDINISLRNIGTNDFLSSYVNNIDGWFKIDFICSDGNTVTVTRLDDSIFINENLNVINIPYKLEINFELNKKRDMIIRCFFKIVNSNLSFVQFCQTLYKDIDVFSPTYSSNMLKISSIPSIINLQTTVNNFEQLLVYDVPVLSLEEIVNNDMANSYLLYIQDLFSNVSKLVNKKGITTTNYSILLGRTKGNMLEYLFNYLKPTLIDSNTVLENAEIKLPIEINVVGKTLENVNIQSIAETIKQRLMLLFQTTTSFFAQYSNYDLLTAISDIEQITKLQVHFQDKVDEIKSLSNISLASVFDEDQNRKWKYRFFVPSLMTTNVSKIMITLV